MTDIRVHDAAHSLAASFDDMLREAALLRDAGLHLGTVSASLHQVLVDADLVASAVLDPVGLARVEQHLLAALDGPHGLTLLAIGLEAQAGGLWSAVHAYRTADQALSDLLRATTWTAGAVAGVTAPLWAVPTGVGLSLLDHATGGRSHEQVLEFLLAHGALTQELLNTAPGLLTGLQVWLPGPDVPVTSLEQGAGLLALLFPNGHGGQQQLGQERPAPPLRSVDDLLASLDEVNDQSGTRTSAHPPQDAVIGVQRVVRVAADGSTTTSWVVDVPGTSTWDGPGSHRNATNTSGNINSMAGNSTAYQQAIQAALADAVRQHGGYHGEPVMLVGHSQGGMVAVQASTALVGQGYQVTHVLTAGSPIAGMSAPPSVRVLSLENTADVVPMLDGRDNPVTSSHTTVTFTDDHHNVADNHKIPTYRAAAAEVDRSREASLEDWKRTAAPFFGGSADTIATYEVYRR